MRNIFTLLVILTILGLSSCKKDSNDGAACSSVWATEVEAELNAVIAAGTAYGSNPTFETCTTYKEAYQDFIDAIRPFAECSSYTAEERQEIQDAIDDSEAQIAALNCQQ